MRGLCLSTQRPPMKHFLLKQCVGFSNCLTGLAMINQFNRQHLVVGDTCNH
jgi:hypothetical protein